ncbi:MAG: SDR family NAD(P)-dependent oxidoreductase [Pseudomonadota bacterium]
MTQKSILITGCSSGIGEHVAHALKARGWRVFATCRKAEDCARLETEGLESFVLDYADTESIRSAVAETLERTGSTLDALYNNGAYAIPGAVEDMPTDAYRAIFEANFFGWHELTRQLIPVMRKQGHGRIIQCSSVLGFSALRMRSPYISTKFALEGYTDCLRYELAHAKTGIHVILLQPGPIDTMIRVKSRPHYEKWIEPEKSFLKDFYAKVVHRRLYAEDLPKDRFELGCDATTAKLIHALESPRPKVRYMVTTPTYIIHWIKRLLPASWVDSVLIRN